MSRIRDAWKAMRRPETRSNGAYGLAWENALLNLAMGSTAASAASTAALGAASGLFARSLAAADVEPPGHPRSTAVSASVRYAIGRDLIETGEHVSLIEVNGGAVRLAPVAAWDITGGHDPSTWRYVVTLEGPSRSVDVSTSADGVLHIRLSPDARRPWTGRPPVGPETDKLAGGIERQLAKEAGAPNSLLFPLPSTGREEEAAGRLTSDIRNPSGLALLELAAYSGQGSALNPYGPLGVRGGFQKLDQSRIGADPPAALVQLRADVFRSVLAACGVPADLFEVGTSTGQREALRRFLHTSVQPIARIVAESIREALEIPDFRLDLTGLAAADVMGRARSWASLVTAGMDPERASEVVGL